MTTLASLDAALLKDICLDQVALSRGLTFARNGVDVLAVVKINNLTGNRDYGIYELRKSIPIFIDENGKIRGSENPIGVYLVVINYTKLIQGELEIISSFRFSNRNNTIYGYKNHTSDPRFQQIDSCLAVLKYMRQYVGYRNYRFVTFGKVFSSKALSRYDRYSYDPETNIENMEFRLDS